MLETSAKHHIPQATNIPYQPCWSNPYIVIVISGYWEYETGLLPLSVFCSIFLYKFYFWIKTKEAIMQVESWSNTVIRPVKYDIMFLVNHFRKVGDFNACTCTVWELITTSGHAASATLVLASWTRMNRGCWSNAHTMNFVWPTCSFPPSPVTEYPGKTPDLIMAPDPCSAVFIVLTMTLTTPWLILIFTSYL